MKVSCEEKKRKFKPITITLVIEDESELAALHLATKPIRTFPIGNYELNPHRIRIRKDRNERAEKLNAALSPIYKVLSDFVEEL